MNPDTQVEGRLSVAFDEPLTAPQRAWLDTRVAAALERAPISRRRFRLRLTRSLLLVGALLVLLPSIMLVGAAIFSTEAPYGMGDADAYDAELADAKAVTPIPPGATWPAYLEQAEDRNATYGTGLGRQMVEFNAYCLWLGDWYQAQERGDASRVMAAAIALDEARGWQTFTDQLTTDQGLRDHVQQTVDAVERGDAQAVLNELEVNCEGTWPPSGDG